MNRLRALPLACAFAALLLAGFVDPADEVARGNAAYAGKEFERAEAHYRSADVHLAGSLETRMNLGAARYRKGDYPAAARFFAEAQGIDAKDPRPPYALGNALFKMDRLEESIAAYEKALELAPGDEDARFNLEQARKKLRMRQQKERQKRPHEQQGEGRQGDPDDGRRDGQGRDRKSGREGDSQNRRDQTKDDRQGETEQGERESAEEREKVEAAKRRMESADLGEQRIRRYLKNLGEEDRQLSDRFRRRIMNRRSERRDPAEMSPEDLFRQMRDPNADPFDRTPRENTDAKDW